MKNKKILQIDWEEIVSIECDKCKNVIDRNNWSEFQEFVSIKFQCGYGSIFFDGYNYEIDLCQFCVKELLGDYLRCIEC